MYGGKWIKRGLLTVGGALVAIGILSPDLSALKEKPAQAFVEQQPVTYRHELERWVYRTFDVVQVRKVDVVAPAVVFEAYDEDGEIHTYQATPTNDGYIQISNEEIKDVFILNQYGDLVTLRKENNKDSTLKEIRFVEDVPQTITSLQRELGDVRIVTGSSQIIVNFFKDGQKFSAATTTDGELYIIGESPGIYAIPFRIENGSLVEIPRIQ